MSAAKATKASAIKIYEGNKLITMTPSMLIDARTHAGHYCGVVEAGMDTVHAVLKNRAGVLFLHIHNFDIIRTGRAVQMYFL